MGKYIKRKPRMTKQTKHKPVTRNPTMIKIHKQNKWYHTILLELEKYLVLFFVFLFVLTSFWLILSFWSPRTTGLDVFFCSCHFQLEMFFFVFFWLFLIARGVCTCLEYTTSKKCKIGIRKAPKMFKQAPRCGTSGASKQKLRLTHIGLFGSATV